MYMDRGIDTGEIIHQARAEIYGNDTPHCIGNRLIKNMTADFVFLIENMEKIEKMKPATDKKGKTYKNKDATPLATAQLYENFRADVCNEYLQTKEERNKVYPIVRQNFMRVY